MSPFDAEPNLTNGTRTRREVRKIAAKVVDPTYFAGFGARLMYSCVGIV